MRVTDTASFIEKSNLVHNFKYDYSKSIYTKSKNKLIITCKEHGDFFQIARDHYNGGFGCSTCSGLKRKTTEDFIKLSNIKHNGKYDYAKSIYKNSKSKIKITCLDHGDFEQIAYEHMSGKGCKACSEKTTALKNLLSKDEFIKRSKIHHGDKYDYSELVYRGLNKIVKIKCKTHGYFHQRANDHQKGMGCNDCARLINNYNRNSFIYYCSRKNGSGILYLISCKKEQEFFFKVGITSKSVDSRFNKLNMPYEIELIATVSGDPKYIWNKEKSIHRDLGMFRHAPSIDFHGKTECFSELTQEVKDFFGVK